MFLKTGEWFMAQGDMNPMDVAQVLKYQEHGDNKKFGTIALNRQMVTGSELRKYERYLLLHI